MSEYLNKFKQYAYSKERQIELGDADIYTWLTKKTIQIENELGGFSVVATYIPPFANYRVNNYQLILNTLPKIYRGIAHDSDIISCIEAMVRYIGMLEDKLTSNKSMMKNPIMWFKEGVSVVVLLPIYFFIG